MRRKAQCVKHFMRGHWLDDDALRECSLLVRYQTQDRDPLFLPELPQDPHPTYRESGDHSAVGQRSEAVLAVGLNQDGIQQCTSKVFLPIFNREAQRPA